MSRRHPIFAAGVAALAAMALVWSMWPAGSGRVPTVEAAHLLSGSPGTQNVVPAQTGIVLTLVGTAVPANVSAAHFNFTYDSALLTATAGTCGASTGNISFPDINNPPGVVDIGCGALPPVASIYGAGGTVNLATVTFTAASPVSTSTSTQTTVAWELLDIGAACLQGHGDSNCTTAGTNALGTITIVVPAGATSTFTPTSTPTRTNTPTPTYTPTPCNTPTGGGSPACPVSTSIVGAAKTATPTGTRTVLATSTAAPQPTGSAPVATATKPGGGAGAGVTGPDTGTGGGSDGGGMTMLAITLIAAVGVASMTGGGWYWLRGRPRR